MMSSKSTKFVLVICVALPLWLGCKPQPVDTIPSLAKSGAAAAQTDADANQPPEPAPDNTEVTLGAAEASTLVQIADLEALEKQIASEQGKIVVLDIWSTSCAPCIKEFPELVKLADQSELACYSLNVDFIGLPSMPVESYQARVNAFLTKRNAQNVKNYLSASRDEEVFAKLGIESIPAVLIFDAAGTLQHKLTDATAGVGGVTYEGDVLPALAAMKESK